jgi:cytochrome b561
MPSNIARYSFVFILIHWVLVLMGFVLLGLGWYIQYMPPTVTARSSLLDLHMSLGLTSVILLSIQLVLWIVFKPSSFTNEFSKWKRLLVYTLYRLIYVSFILMLISGYLQAVFSGMSIQFWGAPLPVWGAADVTLAGFFGTVHGVVAFVLAGSVFVHVCIGAPNIIKHPGNAARLPPLGAQESRELALGEAKSLIASKKISERLGKNLHLFGWIGFWLQLVLAVISALLLAFAATGRELNPGSGWIGSAFDWGVYGFLLLCFAVLMDFYYTRASHKVVSRPDFYFNQKNSAAFWFLGTGMLTGLLGVFISFTGVILSISLLIAKTISVPPGTMIMDVTQIIRAIDVIALVANVNLLAAHSIGTGITLWLSIRASKTRIEYISIR